MIETVQLFVPLNAELVSLLAGLTTQEWTRATVCKGWSVKDIAAHILDGDLRRLSIARDGHRIAPPDGQQLVAWLNSLNHEWVGAMRRLSPAILTALLRWSGSEVAAWFQSLDPHGNAIFPVSWAGHEVSPNWFDIARDYTEKWHHQQQIRDAVGAPPLDGHRWLHPVLETFLHAVPPRLKEQPGVRLMVEVEGEAGGVWIVTGEGVASGAYTARDASIRIPQDTAWRMFTRGVSGDQARAASSIEGDHSVAGLFFGTLAIVG